MNAPSTRTAQSQPTLPSVAAEPTTYLGPARVVRANGRELIVQLEQDDGRQVTVTPAFTFPYRPAVGDTLLVLGQPRRNFAVGVIAGARPAALVFEGDADVRAVNGSLRLTSDRAIELRAPRVTVRAGLVRTIAERCVEKFDGMRRWVRGLLAVRAGESRRLIDGDDTTRCQNSTTLAKGSVKIDGDHLNLGH